MITPKSKDEILDELWKKLDFVLNICANLGMDHERKGKTLELLRRDISTCLQSYLLWAIEKARPEERKDENAYISGLDEIYNDAVRDYARSLKELAEKV